MSSEFSFSLTGCQTKVKKTSLSFHLPIARGWIVACIPYPSVLALCEIQIASSRTWPRVTVSETDDKAEKGEEKTLKKKARDRKEGRKEGRKTNLMFTDRRERNRK